MTRSSVAYWTLGLVATDLVAILAATGLAYYLRFVSGVFPYEQYFPFASYLGFLALEFLAVPALCAANGLYRPMRSISWIDHLYSIFSSVSVGIAVVMVSSTVIWRDFGSSRLLVAFSWLLAVVMIALGRYIIHSIQKSLRMRGVGAERLLIVGTGDHGRLVLDRVRHSPGMGYRPVGFVAESNGMTAVHGLPVLGTLDAIGQVVRHHQIDDVVIASPSVSQRQILDVVGQCSDEHVNIKVVPDLFQYMTSGVNIGDLNGLPLVSVKDIALRGWNLALKRAMDIVVSAVGLVVLAPLLLLISAAIKLTSPVGPVFHIQERVGLDGRAFMIIKFRTMRPDAEKTTGPVWATRDDPRRTPLGAFLRRTSIDELPQLINVLIGDMSLVGPRPERPVFVEQFRKTVPRYFERHREKAGMTGWAQVNGLRGNTSIDERTAYDLWYVENWTFWLDVKIILRTLFLIFTDRNAY